MTALFASFMLAACGGGLVIGIGDGSSADAPPSVSLVSDVDTARSGDVVRLSAAAVDDFAVDHVEFFRVDPDERTFSLGTDVRAPYDWNATMPNATAFGGNFVRFYAVAVDDVGQRSAPSRFVTVVQGF
ncbi:MAG: hypothetical protein RIQ60_2486 [Pseudomonadota bacterium]|jgi:hypothetical protein